MGTCPGMVERTIDRRLLAWPRQTAASRLEIRRARLILIAIAVLLSACDLIVKLIEPTETYLYHRRTYFELVLILAISAAAVYVAPLARSRAIAVGAGLMIGGGIGNAFSIALFPLGVPNPFVVSKDGWIIAFNLADVCVATGFVIMTAAVWSLAIGRKRELGEPLELVSIDDPPTGCDRWMRG